MNKKIAVTMVLIGMACMIVVLGWVIMRPRYETFQAEMAEIAIPTPTMIVPTATPVCHVTIWCSIIDDPSVVDTIACGKWNLENGIWVWKWYDKHHENYADFLENATEELVSNSDMLERYDKKGLYAVCR